MKCLRIGVGGKEEGKGQHKGNTGMDLYNIDAEKLGCAVVYDNKLQPVIVDCEQHSNRNITLPLKTKIAFLNITGTHAPHAEAKEEENVFFALN